VEKALRCLPPGSPSRVLMKLLVDVATDRVVGAHMCGPSAAEVLQGLAIAVRMGATKRGRGLSPRGPRAPPPR